MRIVRYQLADSVAVGLVGEDGSVSRVDVPGIGALLRLPLDEVRAVVGRAHEQLDLAGSRLLPPVDGLTEVWAAGVTYRRSQEARMEESAAGDVYSRVYDADRPELFMKAVAWRVVADGDPIGIRPDSPLNVPEPELALVLNAFGETVGYTICNDVSSRSIEGENPLYLPQAKIYAGSCALGPGIVPAWLVPDPGQLQVSMEILRAGSVAWKGETSTAMLHRTFDDLVEHLFRADAFPEGAVLSTGTGIVPEMSFSLEVRDVVRIMIDGVGTLTNHVATGRDPFTFLVDQLTPSPGHG